MSIFLQTVLSTNADMIMPWQVLNLDEYVILADEFISYHLINRIILYCHHDLL
jgi:hypothetical protein